MNDYYVEPIVINTDEMVPPLPTTDRWKNRMNAYYMYDMPNVPKCSIVVTGYNRLQKTKYCVECILKYTKDVDYELFLLDNGSSDGTYEFFQSVEYKNKRIIRVTQNRGGGGIGLKYCRDIYKGKYFVAVSNDIYVTPNWLSNLLRCYESDPQIGYVQPVSSNVSNLQQVDLAFSNFDEMQQKAALFNKSDPSKWEERMRLIAMISIYSRDVLDAFGWFDASYLHDFSEDDICMRMRRMGYKLMLCRDTWICHDHDFRNMEDKDPAAFQASLECGRAVYREKYYGIDPWDDINNFEIPLLNALDVAQFPQNRSIAALTIDVRCGTPVLEICNRLKRRGVKDIISYAFTTDAKYFLDLQTICKQVDCDRIDYIQEHYPEKTFDLIVLGEPINTYPAPIVLLQKLHQFLKPRGVLLFKVRNTCDYRMFLGASGLNTPPDQDFPSILPPDRMLEYLEKFDWKERSVWAEFDSLTEDDHKFLLEKLKAINPNANDETMKRLCVKNYCFLASRG